MGRLRIPHLIGLVLAGIVVGKYGLNILKRDDSFELFGRVGLFYIMFLAGLEMDLEGLKKNRMRVGIFGLLTFSLPMVLTVWASLSILHLSMQASMLIGCMMASNTLIAYPIVGRLWPAAVDGSDAQCGLVNDFALLGARRLGGHRQLCSGHVELGVLAVVRS